MNIKELLQAKNISKQELEIIFRTSGSADELFDAFRLAINSRVSDPEFYKTLLWNKALSSDEIIMYAEKICREFPEIKYSIYYSAGQIFSSISFYGKHLDKAMNCFKKAAESKPGTSDPYLAVLKMYNHELNVPKLTDVIEMVQSGLERVERKSILCLEISSFFKKLGNKEKERIYRKLGEKYQKEEEG
jgi:tetratricopeptide (TPR) repeat protein